MPLGRIVHWVLSVDHLSAEARTLLPTIDYLHKQLFTSYFVGWAERGVLSVGFVGCSLLLALVLGSQLQHRAKVYTPHEHTPTRSAVCDVALHKLYIRIEDNERLLGITYSLSPFSQERRQRRPLKVSAPIVCLFAWP